MRWLQRWYLRTLRMRLGRSTALVAMLALLAAAAPAQAGDSATVKVYNAYKKTAKVNPCAFTESELKDALGGIGPDLNQYAPDFADAIRTAIQARAQGACGKKTTKPSSSGAAAGAAGAAATPPSSGTGSGSGSGSGKSSGTAKSAAPTGAAAPAAAATTPQPAPVNAPAAAVNDNAIPAAAQGPNASGSDGAPAPLLILAIMAGMLLVIGGGWAGARMLGFDPPWVARWRHAGEEAGWRASSAWSDFADWLRFGR